MGVYTRLMMYRLIIQMECVLRLLFLIDLYLKEESFLQLALQSQEQEEKTYYYQKMNLMLFINLENHCYQ